MLYTLKFPVELGAVMDWRYQAGLGLIGAFVIIWVASAEITQVWIFMFAFFRILLDNNDCVSDKFLKFVKYFC